MKNTFRYRLLILLAAGVCAALFSCGTDDSPIDSTSEHFKAIIISGNSAIRIDPILFSSRVALLKKGEVVEVIERSKTKSWIGKTNDYWFKVRRNSGIVGWTFGTNIKLLRPGTASLEQYISDFMKDDSKEVIKALTGKWWSVNSFGDFTNHCIEIKDDNTYKSYTKGGGAFFSGEYTFDFNKNQIIFLKGATFGNSLDMIKRGQTYMLQKEQEDQIVQFKRIAAEIKDEPEPEPEKKVEAADETKTE